jgi:hypothetical protein
MVPDQDNFERLQSLLTLKRYEQPPPGYFHHFSQQVILRIKDGETGEETTLFGRWFGDASWLHRIFGSFETRPALGGAMGLAICGLMLIGIFYGEPESSPMPGMVTGTHLSVLDRSMPEGTAYAQAVTMADLSSTNGVLTRHLRDSLFDQVRRPPARLINSLSPVN